MAMFWLGYLAAILTYLTVGGGFGIWMVVTHLDRFHGGGFQWRRMAGHILLLMFFWPATFIAED